MPQAKASFSSLIKDLTGACVSPAIAFAVVIFAAGSVASMALLANAEMGDGSSTPASQLFSQARAAKPRVLGETAAFYPYPSGSLVNDNGTIYFISGTSKVPFTNWQAFTGLGYSLGNVISGDLTNYTPAANYVIDSPNMAHPWGSWLIYRGTVYYSTADGLIGAPSGAVFAANGGVWNLIVKANAQDIAEFNSHPNLAVLTANDSRVTNTPTTFASNLTNQNTAANTSPAQTSGASAHPAGTIVNDSGTFYLVTANGRQGITSWATFLSLNYTGNVAAANAADRALPLFGTVAANQPVQTSPANTLFTVLPGNPLVTPNLSARSLTVLSPNGGETIRKGLPYTITWTSSGVSNVYIILRKGVDTYYGSAGMVTGNISNTGSYTWNVPADLPDGSDYGIRVIDSTLAVLDDSNASFSIAGAAASASSATLTVKDNTSGQTITANGGGAGQYLNVNAGDALTYWWSSTGAATGSSTLQVINSSGAAVTNDTCSPANTSGGWIIAGPQGSTSGAIAACQNGFSYKISFSAGAASPAEVKIRVGQATVSAPTATLSGGPNLPAAVVGNYYTFSFPFTYTGTGYIYATMNNIPPGMQTDPLPMNNVGVLPTNNLVLTGYPSQAGTFNFSITLDNHQGVAITKNYTLTVNSSSTASQLPDFTVGTMNISPKLPNASNAIEVNKTAIVTFTVTDQGGAADLPTMQLDQVGGLQTSNFNFSIPENTCSTTLHFSPGQSCVYAFQVVYSQTSTASNYASLKLTVDNANWVAESNESNNWGVINFDVRTANSVPTLTSLSANSGPAGASITINGTDLGLLGQTTTVKFGTTVANFGLGTGSNIQGVIVPNLPAGTYQVTVQVGSNITNALSFTVTSSSVSSPTASLSLSPNGGTAGNSFTLTMTSNQPANTPFYLCSYFTASSAGTGVSHGDQCSTVPLYTQSGGGYQWTGTWDNSHIGSWSEWVKFGATNSQAISFTVTAAANISSLSVSPASLSFSAAQGGSNPASQILNITSNTSWSISGSSNGWLTVSPSGSFINNGSIWATVVSSNLAVGTYNGSITISGNFTGSPKTLPVTLTVTGAPAPTASLSLSPNGGAAGTSFTLTMTSNQPANMPFYLCSNFTAATTAGISHGDQCAPSPSYTNLSGGYQWTGAWDSSHVGSWSEWVKFGGTNLSPISFTVN